MIEKSTGKPLVSIVIPTYNQERFIKDTLKSVLSQSYRNLQIIVCDDCSTDGTLGSVLDIAKKDNRVQLLTSEKNQGISRNFNKAFDAVQGEYVAFLGGDDLMFPLKIEKQLNFLLENEDYSMVMHKTELFDFTKKKTKLIHGSSAQIPLTALQWAFPLGFLFNKQYDSIVPSSCLARSSYYLSSKYDLRLNYKHELLFYLDIYMNQPKAKWMVLDEVLGRYNYHEDNFSTDNNNKSLIFEETVLFSAIAASRYPQIYATVRKNLMTFLFYNLKFGWIPRDVEYSDKDFKQEYGLWNYLFLLVCSFYSRIKKKLT